MQKETHRFYIDEPVTIWRRYWYDVPGNYSDAVIYMKQELDNPQMDDEYFIESELLFDTECYDESGRELFNNDGEEL